MDFETFERARLYFDLGDPAGAARILEPQAREEDRNRAVLELLARAYFHSAQLTRAEQTFGRLVELDPSDAYARFCLARSLERQGRAREAAAQRRLAAALGMDATGVRDGDGGNGW